MSNTIVSRDEDPIRPTKISILTNSIFFFINSVFIISQKETYYLVANHKGKLLIDKPYKTLRGAKIAFSRLFGHRGWKEDLKANWSIFYKPETRWLREKGKGTKMLEW